VQADGDLRTLIDAIIAAEEIPVDNAMPLIFLAWDTRPSSPALAERIRTAVSY
jgi:hypothetical protein